MPADALELREGPKAGGIGAALARKWPPIFLLRRRGGMPQRIVVMRLKDSRGTVVVALGAQLVKIGTGDFAPVAHQVDKARFRKCRGQTGYHPGHLVRGIAPMRRVAVADRAAISFRDDARGLFRIRE